MHKFILRICPGMKVRVPYYLSPVPFTVAANVVVFFLLLILLRWLIASSTFFLFSSDLLELLSVIA